MSMMEEAEEIEVSFRLDEEGRTIPPSSSSSANVLPPSNGGATTACAGGGGETTTNVLEYGSRTVVTSLRYVAAVETEKDGTSSSSELLVDNVESAMDELLLDAEISDCGLMPRTFWVPAPMDADEEAESAFTPRCSLEQFALDVFRYHTARAPRGTFDPANSGAEWWVQIRPSPEGTGRYAMLEESSGDGLARKDNDHDDDDDDDCVKKGGISFHWDKDEDLRQLTGGTTYVHPHLSTVTYLTGIGAPTLAVNYRVHNLTGETLSNPDVEAFVSWPSPLKHMVFDGRFLHAGPADLMEDGEWVRQTTVPLSKLSTDDDDDDDVAERKRVQRRHRRVTFLVNIWLNYHPFNVNPFPDTMIDKMSGCREQRRVGLSFSAAPPKSSVHRAPETASLVVDDAEDQSSADYRVFTWPMGNYESGERIRMSLPVRTIRSMAKIGGNAHVRWKDNDKLSDRKRVVLITREGQESGKVETAPESSSQPMSRTSPSEDEGGERSRKRARSTDQPP